MSVKLEEQFPAIASWIHHGWIEIGNEENFGFVAMGYDCGGMVFKSKPDKKKRTLDECMLLLERGLREHMKDRFGDEF